MNRIFILWGCLLLTACSYNESKKSAAPAGTPPQKVTSADQITYKMVRESVFQTSCFGCHSNAGGNKKGVNLETYENTFKHRQQIRMEVSGATMPPSGRLTEEQIKLVQDWIDAGALENGKADNNQPPAEPPVQPPATTFFYEPQIKKIIADSCLKCHNRKDGNPKDIFFESYAEVFARRELIKVNVESGRMPLDSNPEFTDEYKKQLLTWIEQGSPEKPN